MNDICIDELSQQWLYEACARGATGLLRDLVEESPCRVDIAADDNRALVYAAACGRLKVLRYLLEQAPRYCSCKADTGAMGFAAFISAAMNGHLNVVRYLLEKAPRYGYMLPDHDAFDNALLNAAQKGRSAVAGYLADRGAPALGISEIHADAAFSVALRNLNIRTLRLLISTPTTVRLSRKHTDFTIQSFFSLADTGGFSNREERITGERLAMADYLLHEFPFVSGHAPDLGDMDNFPAGVRLYLESKRIMLKSLRGMSELGIPHGEWRGLLARFTDHQATE